MGCQHLDEYYELFLLGTVSGGACDDIREHVERECPYCLEHLREAMQSVYLISVSTHSARPNPKQKALLLRRLKK